MYISELEIKNFRAFKYLKLPLREGLTAFVGPNDAGKTAIVDAIRYALGTRDQDFIRLEDSDFHFPSNGDNPESDISVRCKFDGLTLKQQSAFIEYLSYEETQDAQIKPVLYINWIAKKKPQKLNRRSIFTETKIR